MDGIAKAGASSRTPKPAFASTTGGQKQIPRLARDDKSRATSHGSQITKHGPRVTPLSRGQAGGHALHKKEEPEGGSKTRRGHDISCPYKKKETQEKGARLRRRPLHGGEGGEFGAGNGFLLDEDLEAFAHAFGIDKRFELQARADAAGFIHAIIVEVGELVPLS